MTDSEQLRVGGVLETSLYVSDLDRSERFYRALFGFTTMWHDDRLRALDVGSRQVLLLFKKGATRSAVETPGGSIPPHDGDGRLHLAFAIPRDSIDRWQARLADAGTAIESAVTAARGGTSMYFRDPDGHLIELATPGIWDSY